MPVLRGQAGRLSYAKKDFGTGETPVLRHLGALGVLAVQIIPTFPPSKLPKSTGSTAKLKSPSKSTTGSR